MRIGILTVALLVAASCSAPSTSTAQESEGRSVPLDLSSGRPVLQAQINGRGPFPMIFDTGAGTAVLLDSFERELGLEVRGHTPLGSPLGGAAPPVGDLVSLDTVSIGGIRRDNLQAVSIDDSLLPLRGARGILGPATIPDRIVEIDVSGGTLWIGPAPRQPITQWNRIGHRGMLDATITIGGVAIPAHIDTGNPGSITLPLSFAERLSLREPLRESGGMRTIDATRIMSLGRLDADADISGTPVRLDVVNFADLSTAGIGSQALAGFTIVVDYAHRRWAMVGASAGPIVAQPPLGGFGARVMPQADGAALEVFGLEPGSRAEASGLLVGDRILGVDDHLVATANPAQLREAAARPGARITVQRNGATVELTAP